MSIHTKTRSKHTEKGKYRIKIFSTLCIGIFVLMVIQMSTTVVIEVEALNNDEIQAGDMNILSEVTVINITLSQIDETGTGTPLLHLDSPIKVVSSTSQDLLYTHFLDKTHQMYQQMVLSATGNPIRYKLSAHLNELDVNEVLGHGNTFPLYPMTSSGYQKLDRLPTIVTKHLLKLQAKYKLGKLNRITSSGNGMFGNANSVQYLGNATNNQTSSSNVSESYQSFLGDFNVSKNDFKTNGFETVYKDRISTGDILASGDRAYENLSEITFSEPIDYKYIDYATQTHLLNDETFEYNTDVLRTEELLGETSHTNRYTIVSSGYTNFEKESIFDPISDWFVLESEKMGTLVNKDSIVVDYSNVNDTRLQQFMSSTMQKVIMSPIDDEIDKQNKDSWIGYRINTYLNIAGFSIHSNEKVIHSGSALKKLAGFAKTPLLRLNSFRALSRGTTSSLKSRLGENIQFQRKIRDMSSSGLGCAASTTRVVSDYSGFSRSGCSAIASIRNAILRANNPHRVTSSATVQDTIIKNNSFKKTLLGFAPFLLLGVGLLIVVFLLFRKKTPGI